MATDIGSIIARLYLDRTPFTRELAAAKAEARAFGDVVVPVAADTARFDAASAEVFAAKNVMSTPVDTTVAANTGPFDLGAAQVEAMKKAMSKPVEIPVEIDASKLNLFKRLVSGGESPGDVAKYLGFSRQELSSALGTIAMQAAEDARAQFADAGKYAAEQMIAGWMAASQRELGAGSPIESGIYRLLTGGTDPYTSTGGAIPMPPKDSGWRFWSPPLPPAGELGSGESVSGWGFTPPPPAPPWIPPELMAPPERLQLLASNPESPTYRAYQKMYQAWQGTSGSQVWTEGPIPAGVVGDQGPGWGAAALSGLTGAFSRLGGRNDSGGIGVLAPLAAAGGAGGLLSSLLWGGGSGGIGPIGAGMAGFGSLGSLAGLGPEHLLMTGLGLGGFAAGGAAGGALLGLGSLGVMGVGMGTDLAGIGQAAGDIKAVYAAQQQLNQAIAQYGPNSQQAIAAQRQLNYTVSGFAPVAQAAVIAASNTATQFKAMFDQLTGPAEKVGAQIIQQAMQVGEKFLPTIGKFAAQNMGIIKTSLQPLLSWLQGPGLAIFTQLEKKFQSDLPIAMHAFDQGVELVMRTIGLIAPKTGGLIKWIDQLVTKFNGAGWGKWSGEVNRLIGDFRQWEALIKIVVEDVYQLFHHDAGTASSIVGALTQMLTKLHQWETSTAGGNALHNIFAVHKQEILALLQLLPALVSSFGTIYMTVAPALTGALTTVLRDGVLPLVDAMAHNPFGAWVLGVALITAKLGVLKPLIGGVLGPFRKALTDLGTSLGGVALGGLQKLAGLAWGAMAAGVRAAAGAFESLDLSMAALGAVGIIAVVVGVYELIHHFGVLPGLIYAGAIAIGVLTVAFWALDAVPVVALIVGIGLAIAGLIAGVIELVKHWSTVAAFFARMWGDMEKAAVAGWKAVSGFFKVLWADIEKYSAAGWKAVVGFFTHLWTDITKAAATGAKDFVAFFEKLPGEAV